MTAKEWKVVFDEALEWAATKEERARKAGDIEDRMEWSTALSVVAALQVGVVELLDRKEKAGNDS